MRTPSSRLSPGLPRRGAPLLARAFFGAALALVLLEPRSAWAYIDVGAGSLLFQFLAASALAGLYVVKAQWRRLCALLSSEDSAPAPPQDTAGDTESPRDRT